MLVWFTEWQVGEEHLLITVGDIVDFTLYPANSIGCPACLLTARRLSGSLTRTARQ